MSTLIVSSLIAPDGAIVHQNVETLTEDYVHRGSILSSMSDLLGIPWSRCITDDGVELTTPYGWTYKLEAREV